MNTIIDDMSGKESNIVQVIENQIFFFFFFFFSQVGWLAFTTDL